jgi:uncharacterized protein with HEPN domain
MRSRKLISDQAITKFLQLISVIESYLTDVAHCDVEADEDLLGKVTLQIVRISKASRLLLPEVRAAHREVAWSALMTLRHSMAALTRVSLPNASGQNAFGRTRESFLGHYAAP